VTEPPTTVESPVVVPPFFSVTPLPLLPVTLMVCTVPLEPEVDAEWVKSPILISSPVELASEIVVPEVAKVAVMPVLPDLSLIAETKAVKSEVVTVAEMLVATVFDPNRLNDTVPFALKLESVAVVLAVAVTAVVLDAALTAVAMFLAEASEVIDTVEFALPTIVSVCVATLLPPEVLDKPVTWLTSVLAAALKMLPAPEAIEEVSVAPSGKTKSTVPTLTALSEAPPSVTVCPPKVKVLVAAEV